MVSRVIPVDTFDLVIFGGTGDLADAELVEAAVAQQVECTVEERPTGAPLVHRAGLVVAGAGLGAVRAGGAGHRPSVDGGIPRWTHLFTPVQWVCDA